MKKAVFIILLLFIISGLVVSGVSAATVTLYDWVFNVDGTTYENWLNDPMPATGALTDGLGVLTWSTNSPGSHNFIAFFDYEIDFLKNGLFNEYGVSNGSPAVAQSWEIDEPGYIYGDIYFNVLEGELDNTNSVPPGSEHDVSMALGWNFTLTDDQAATITLMLTDEAPTEQGLSLYLSHTDPDSDNYTIYYSSTLDIKGESGVIPEPGTLVLMCCGILGLIGLKKRYKQPE